MSSATSEPDSEPTTTRIRPTSTEEKTTTTTERPSTTTTEERETTTTKPITTTTTSSTASKMSSETTTTDPLTTTTTTDPTTTTTISPTTTTTTTTAWTTTTTTTPTTTTATTTTTTTRPVTTTTTTTTITTRTTRTRPPTTLTTKTRSTGTSDLYTSTTASYTATYISSTSSSNSAGPIVSPTLAPIVNNSSISTGAIVGIIIAALLGIIAALIAAFMIKRHRRRQIHRTSNTLFNPVNLDMQENHSRYPSGPNGGGSSSGGYGTSNGYFQGLSGRESAEPLNAAMLGASGISAASALGHSDAGTLYPYESDPRYFHRGSTVLPQVAEGDGSGEIGYGPTSMDPAYLAYGAYGQHGNHHDPQDEEAYMRYEQQLYQQQLQQDPHQQDLHAPVAYYDPTSGEFYYPDYTAEQQQQAYAPSAENGSPSAVGNSLRQQYVLSPPSPHDPHTLPAAQVPGEDDESPEAAAEAAAAARRISDTAMSSSSTYVDAESDAHHSKSAWPILHRSSLLSNTSSSAGNRNPQGLLDKISTGTTIKVPVPEEGENPSVSN